MARMRALQISQRFRASILSYRVARLKHIYRHAASLPHVFLKEHCFLALAKQSHQVDGR